MKKILISDAIMKEILDKDLGISDDNKVQGYNHVRISDIKSPGYSQQTTDDFARQSIPPHQNFGMNGAIRTYLREDENSNSVGDINILNTYGEKALAIDVVNLSKSFSALEPKQSPEIISTSLYYILNNIDWTKIDPEMKQTLKEIIQ